MNVLHNNNLKIWFTKNYDFPSELISTHCKVGILRATNLVFVVIQFGQSVNGSAFSCFVWSFFPISKVAILAGN